MFFLANSNFRYSLSLSWREYDPTGAHHVRIREQDTGEKTRTDQFDLLDLSFQFLVLCLVLYIFGAGCDAWSKTLGPLLLCFRRAVAVAIVVWASGG